MIPLPPYVLASPDFLRWGLSVGAVVSVDAPGPKWLIHGGLNGYGPHGHIAFDCGDGSLIEAAGHAAGIRHVRVYGIGSFFTDAVRVPGATAADIAAMIAFEARQCGKPYTTDPVGRFGPDGWDCLTGETIVYGERGATPIADLQPGDRVWAWADGRLVLRPVLAKVAKPPRAVYEVRTTRRLIRGTANHPVLRVAAPDGRSAGYARTGADMSGAYWGRDWRTEWTSIGDLRLRDAVVTVDSLPLDGEPYPVPFTDATTTDEFMWLLGLYLADGHTSATDVRICVFGDLRDRTREIVERVFECGTSSDDKHGLIVYSSHLARVVRSFDLGTRSHNKHVPEWVWTLPRKQIEAFLDGYRTGDGHDQSGYRSYAAWSLHSTSERMIREMRALHQALGHNTSHLRRLDRTKPIVIKGQTVRHARPIWSFEVYPESTRKGRTDLYRHGMRSVVPEPFSVERVLSIRQVDAEATYDIEVADAHSFLADGIVVHNCSGLQVGAVRYANSGPSPGPAPKPTPPPDPNLGTVVIGGPTMQRSTYRIPMDEHGDGWLFVPYPVLAVTCQGGYPPADGYGYGGTPWPGIQDREIGGTPGTVIEIKGGPPSPPATVGTAQGASVIVFVAHA